MCGAKGKTIGRAKLLVKKWRVSKREGHGSWAAFAPGVVSRRRPGFAVGMRQGQS